MKSNAFTCITAMTLFTAMAFSVRMAAQEKNQQPTSYTVIDLGTLGGTFGAANAVNNRGSVVGASNLPGDTESHAFLWSKGIKSDLGTLGGPNSSAAFINERGEVAGSAETSPPDPLGEDFCVNGTHLICLPFLWQEGLMAPLPALGGNNGVAIGINSRGQVGGTAENATPDPTCPSPPVFPFFSVLESKPVIWEKGEIQQELPTIGGDPDGFVSAINDNGQAVGLTGNCINTFHAVLWNKGTPTDLGTLDGMLLNATAINNRGQVVGLASSQVGFVAFLWQNGVATNLGTLPPDVFSFALGINDKGQVVGGSCDADFSCRAFLWQDGTMTDLNTLIPSGSDLFLPEARDVNSRGQIVGPALQISTGEIHAFLATPSNGEDGESAPPAAQGQARRGATIILPVHVRKMLRDSLAKPYPRGGLGGWNLK